MWEFLQILINLSEKLSAENLWKEQLHCMRQNLSILKRYPRLRYQILYAQLTSTTEETLLILGIQTSFLAANHTTYLWEWGMNTSKWSLLEASGYLCKFRCFSGPGQIFDLLFSLARTFGRRAKYNLQTSTFFFVGFKNVISNIMTKYCPLVCLVQTNSTCRVISLRYLARHLTDG